MTTTTLERYRLCPNCGSHRPEDEMVCTNLIDGQACFWPLADQPLVERVPEDQSAPVAPPQARDRKCVNGHPMADDMEICFVCGADPSGVGEVAIRTGQQTSLETPTVLDVEPGILIDGYSNFRRVPGQASQPFDTFLADDGEGQSVFITVYSEGSEPDPDVYQALSRLSHDHVPDLIATGRHEGRAYDVFEWIPGGSLAEAGHIGGNDPNLLVEIIQELAGVLAGFEELGLRHRDLNPRTVLLRGRSPLDLVVTGFGSARLSDFDLESVAPLELTRYSAPEAIVGAVSAASDWWSLGIIVLEQATSGRCFDGTNEQAWRLHVVTRGVEVTPLVDPRIRQLLRGLLARDPHARWSSGQVRLWLRNEYVDTPDEERPIVGEGNGTEISLGGRDYTRADQFALAAAEPDNWDEAQELILSGRVGTWLSAAQIEGKIQARFRRAVGNENIAGEYRHALALMAMNPELPLTIRGEIVTPAWLLSHPDDGYEIVVGEVGQQLEQFDKASWIVALASRAEAVRDRARLLEIELDESRLRVALLSTSRPNLEAERDVMRRVYPDTDHAGLASILERPRLSDEDLIILVSAATQQFVPLATLVSTATDLAIRTQVKLDPEATEKLFVMPRREIFALVDQRTANFARCDIPSIDEWVDTFRVERRMSLPRAAVLLAVPEERWKEPPKQQYIANLLNHFEKRVTGTVSRGPLARFSIGKTTPRLDLMELGTALRPAESILNHLISRTDAPVPLDPSAYAGDENRESRFRRLISHAQTFRRDTGLDGRTLGFPFLVVREARSATSDAEARPRVAPVLLWPIAIDLPLGGGSATIAFDKEREEVRLNPALETMLPPNEMQRWRAALNELLSRGAVRYSDVIDVFGSHAAPRSRSLERLISRDAKVPVGTFQLHASAALFNAEFAGQAIAEDMRQMVRMPPAGTGLEAVLRIVSGNQEAEQIAASERDRFLVAPADPSQEAAVFQSRANPGLLVEGPPGTGKSQTIVNVVTDAIGRGETVLVVCQKQAALKVVQKRLEAEGLGDRLFLVVDVNKDREAVVKAIREQRDKVRQAPEGRLTSLLRQRDDKIARIETLEREVDGTHTALHQADEITGLNYRDILGQLIELEESGSWIAAAELRPLLGMLAPSEVSVLEETCGPLARLWLEAGYEGSPLAVLKPFAVDPSVVASFESQLTQFAAVEAARDRINQTTPASPEVDDVDTYKGWLGQSGQMLESSSGSILAYLRVWWELFREAGQTSEGDLILRRVEELGRTLASLPPDQHDDALFPILLALNDGDATRLNADVVTSLSSPGFFGFLNFGRHARVGRVKAFLKEHSLKAEKPSKARLQSALELELSLRPLRREMNDICAALGVAQLDGASLSSLRDYQSALYTTLGAIRPLAMAVLSCPWPDEAVAAVATQDPSAFASIRERMQGAFARNDARLASGTSLAQLEAWFGPEWVEAIKSTIKAGQTTSARLETIRAAVPRLSAYQRFRLRAAALPTEALQIFSILRQWDDQLEVVSRNEVDALVRRTIRREALLAWKGRVETALPDLLVEESEINQKVASLAVLDSEVFALNRQILRLDIDPNRLGTSSGWEDLTRLRGPRARRLREVIDLGRDMGLMRMRPIWLMNPDVASRLLPLKSALFDVVIYDEASQMPVEFAVPTLFRAKRILIAGDEKQMPPTSFFATRIDDDEEENSDDAFNDAVTEVERTAQEEAWNRREVKDCPDLLQLGRGSLPATTLQIHYRSKYRELIDYSNSAFYRGDLSVPASHPAEEIRRVRPIEVIRADGIYEAQTNQIEAERVVEVVAGYWKQSSPPSIGVVTFNRKQADLVEEAFEKRAASDTQFLLAYRRERDRTQNGEDMGFFVKNVENVQGDERDIIVFSTTFGKDKHGAFRRMFGVLGQAGGERRLNVAVTRAREKVVLVTSMPTQQIGDWLKDGKVNKPSDYLQAYIDYAERLSDGELDAARSAAKRLNSGTSANRNIDDDDAENGFVRSVGRFLQELGFDAVPSRTGDAFRLDFAIKNPNTGLFGLGIECDAPRHGLLVRARAREIWRPKILSREIPNLHRVTSKNWYAEPEEERARLKAAVEAAMV